MLVNICLLSLALALIVRALRFRIQLERIPFPSDKPRGLFGWQLLVIHVPRGCGFRAETRVNREG